jgi:hypothetical protein
MLLSMPNLRWLVLCRILYCTPSNKRVGTSNLSGRGL